MCHLKQWKLGNNSPKSYFGIEKWCVRGGEEPSLWQCSKPKRTLVTFQQTFSAAAAWLRGYLDPALYTPACLGCPWNVSFNQDTLNRDCLYVYSVSTTISVQLGSILSSLRQKQTLLAKQTEKQFTYQLEAKMFPFINAITASDRLVMAAEPYSPFILHLRHWIECGIVDHNLV